MNENFKVEPRSRKHEGLAPLAKEVAVLTKNVLADRGFVGPDIIENWTDIIGKELAQGIRPVRLTFPNGLHAKGTLHVRTAGGAFALLFEHEKERVIERINTYFGYPAIAQIRQEQGSIRLPKAEVQEAEWPLDDSEVQTLLKKVDAIQDDVLRAKMLELGISLIQKEKRS